MPSDLTIPTTAQEPAIDWNAVELPPDEEPQQAQMQAKAIVSPKDLTPEQIDSLKQRFESARDMLQTAKDGGAFGPELMKPLEDHFQELSDALRQTGQHPNLNPIPQRGIAMDLIAGVASGGTKAVKSVANMAGAGLEPETDKYFAPQSIPGRLAEGVVQFGVGWEIGGGLLKGAGVLQGAGKGVAAARGLTQGAIANFTAFDGHAERLSNLVQQYPSLQNPVTEFLASDPGDSQALGRFKSAVEGTGLGLATEKLLGLAVSGFKKMRVAYAKGGQAAADAVAEEVAPQINRAAQAAQKAMPAEDAIRERAASLWEKAGKPVGQDEQLWLQAERELISEADASAQTQIVKKVGPPAEAVVMDEGQKTYLADQLAKVKSGELSVAGVVPDFNMDKLVTDKSVKDTIELVGSYISEDVAKLKGGVQSFAEIDAGAQVYGQNPQQLLQYLAADAATSAERAKRFVGGKMVMQGMARKVADLASQRGVRGGDAKFAEELAAHTDIFTRTYAYLKAIQTGSARTTAVGRLMSKEMVLSMTPEQLTAWSDELAATGGDILKMSKVMQPSMLNKIINVHNEYWIGAGLMSDPATFERNLFNNLYRTVMVPGIQTVGAMFKGDIGTAVEGLRIYAGYRGAFRDAIGWAARSFMEERNFVHGGKFREIPKAISSVYLGLEPASTIGQAMDFIGKNFIRPFGRAMTATDELFNQILYRSNVRARAMGEASKLGMAGDEAAGYASRKVVEAFDNLGHATDPAAITFAADTTFNRELGYGVTKDLMPVLAKHPALKILAPFMKIGVNIQRQAIATVPGVNFLQRQFRQDFFSKDPSMRALAMGKMMTGAAMYALGAGLAYEGKMTGRGPTNPNLRRAWLDAGNQPYSFVLDNEDGSKTYINYQHMEPYATVYGLMADFKDIAGEMDDDEAQNTGWALVSALANNFVSKTYVRGMAQGLDAMGGDIRDIKKMMQNFVATHVPGVLKRFDGDPNMREVRGVMDAVMDRIPGYSETLPPRRNILGQPILMPGGYGIDSLNPFALATGMSDPVKRELVELGQGFSLPPSRLGGGGNVEGVDLRTFKNAKGQDAYDRYQELVGEVKIGGMTVAQAMEETIKSDLYKSLPKKPGPIYMSERVNMINGVLGGYRKMAEAKLHEEYPQIMQQLIQRAEGAPAAILPK